jgi:hypothetical protein
MNEFPVTRDSTWRAAVAELVSHWPVDPSAVGLWHRRYSRECAEATVRTEALASYLFIGSHDLSEGNGGDRWKAAEKPACEGGSCPGMTDMRKV